MSDEVDVDENVEASSNCSEYIPDTSAESSHYENNSCSEYLPDTSEETQHSENSSCGEYIPGTLEESLQSETVLDEISAIEGEKLWVKKLVSMEMKSK